MQSAQKESTRPQSTSSSQALPANVPALLESVWALTMSVTDGRSASESFATLNQDGVFLKTCQGSCQLMLDGSLETFSGSWPKSGMMLAGQCMEPPTLEHRTSGKDCALWPTVRAGANRNSRSAITGKNNGGKHKSDMGLEQAIEVDSGILPKELRDSSELPPRFRALWPTPTINGKYNRKGVSSTSGDGLATAVNNWATPNTMDCLPPKSEKAIQYEMEVARKGRSSPANLRDQVGGNWPAPTARDHEDGSAESCKNVPTNGLLGRVVHEDWPTPQANSSNGIGHSENKKGAPNLQTVAGGQLNADWVDCLMGYPPGWTETKLCATFNLFRKRNPEEVFSQPWPSRRGEPQHDWEPPRVITGQKGRVARIKMDGNAVVPQWAYIPLYAIAAILESQMAI